MSIQTTQTAAVAIACCDNTPSGEEVYCHRLHDWISLCAEHTTCCDECQEQYWHDYYVDLQVDAIREGL